MTVRFSRRDALLRTAAVAAAGLISGAAIPFNFSTALSGVVSTGRPVTSATCSAAGAMLYCASAMRSHSRRSFEASTTRRSWPKIAVARRILVL